MEEAIHDNIYYQDNNILKEILPDYYKTNEEITEKNVNVFNEYCNDTDFLSAANNETMRRYLEEKKKLNEYLYKYERKCKQDIINKKKERLREFVENKEFTSINVNFTEYKNRIITIDRGNFTNMITINDKKKKKYYYRLIAIEEEDNIIFKQ